jgi:hypothetical protein
LELADRCEKATGPDRAIDALIASALGWERYEFHGENDYEETGWHTPGNPLPVSSLPRWSASLDAAMTLCPSDCVWDVTSTGTSWIMPEGLLPQVYGKAATPALALCAAALRAQAEGSRNG